MSTPSTNPSGPTPDVSDPKVIRQCRSLTVDGLQCLNRALRGKDFCYQHFTWRNSPTLPAPDKIAVPLLESHSAIQRVLSQILHGILSRELPPDIANRSIYCCQVALSSMPRPTAPQPRAAEAPPPAREPVVDLGTDGYGNLVGPRQPYVGPTGAFEPIWSMAKYMYEQDCERLGKPKPTCAADMPASGWLTPDEAKEDPEAFNARYHTRLAELIKQNPPPPRPPACPSGFNWCGGPACSHHCNRCEKLIEEKAAQPAESTAKSAAQAANQAPAPPQPPPAPASPVSCNPAPGNPAPGNPAPCNPAPCNPAPGNPAPANSAAADPGSANFDLQAVAEPTNKTRHACTFGPHSRSRVPHICPVLADMGFHSPSPETVAEQAQRAEEPRHPPVHHRRLRFSKPGYEGACNPTRGLSTSLSPRNSKIPKPGQSHPSQGGTPPDRPLTASQLAAS